MSEKEPEKPPELPMPPGVGIGAPFPEAAPPLSDLLCLNGPLGRCRHLWDFQTNFEHGNAAGSLERAPRHDRRICQCGGGEMDLAGAAVYSCNRYKKEESQ